MPTSTTGSITTTRLSCGMTLVIEPMSGVRSASASWLLATGAGRDPLDKQGLSAMWSELLMRGAGPLSSREQADAFDRLGASRSIDGGVLTMRLHATAMGARLPDVLPLLVDMVRTPTMADAAIEPARELALQDLDSVKDDPQERVALLAKARHARPPLDRSGLGTVDGLNAITRDDLLSLWFQHARPRSSILGVAGDVDPHRLAHDLERLLHGWEGDSPEPALGSTPARGYEHTTDETNQVQILVMQDAPPEPHPDSLLERLAISVLSGGMSGRLFTEVREKRGLCYSVGAGYAPDRDVGTVSAYVGTTPERAQQSLDVLAAEMERINTPDGRVTPEEFDKARVGMKSALVFAGESAAARAGALAADVRKIGRARALSELARDIDAISLDQLNAYLARRTTGSVTVQTLGPAALKCPW
jgi:predicted Zn-dependent peptidase